MVSVMTRLALAVVAGIVLMFVAFLVILRAVTNDEPQDCSKPLMAGEWTGERANRDELSTRIGLCRLLAAKSEAETTRLMGRPDHVTANRWEYAIKPGHLDLGRLDLYFARGRVERVRGVVTGVPY